MTSESDVWILISFLKRDLNRILFSEWNLIICSISHKTHTLEFPDFSCQGISEELLHILKGQRGA